MQVQYLPRGTIQNIRLQYLARLEANNITSGKACLLIYERRVWLFCLLQNLVEDGKDRAYEYLTRG